MSIVKDRFSSNNTYLLDGCVPYLEPDILAWADKMGEQWRSGKNVIARSCYGGTRVSTVFLGMDPGFYEPPQLFETMIFSQIDSPLDGFKVRASCWPQALECHAEACSLALREKLWWAVPYILAVEYAIVTAITLGYGPQAFLFLGLVLAMVGPAATYMLRGETPQ